MKHWQLQSRGDFELDICLLGYNLKAERSLWGFMKYISSENYKLEIGELYLVEEKELVCLKSWLFSLGSSHFVFMTTVWYWYSCKVWFTVVGTEAWWQFEPMTPWHQLLYLCPHHTAPLLGTRSPNKHHSYCRLSMPCRTPQFCSGCHSTHLRKLISQSLLQPKEAMSTLVREIREDVDGWCPRENFYCTSYKGTDAVKLLPWSFLFFSASIGIVAQLTWCSSCPRNTKRKETCQRLPRGSTLGLLDKGESF